GDACGLGDDVAAPDDEPAPAPAGRPAGGGGGGGGGGGPVGAGGRARGGGVGGGGGEEVRPIGRVEVAGEDAVVEDEEGHDGAAGLGGGVERRMVVDPEVAGEEDDGGAGPTPIASGGRPPREWRSRTRYVGLIRSVLVQPPQPRSSSRSMSRGAIGTDSRKTESRSSASSSGI